MPPAHDAEPSMPPSRDAEPSMPPAHDADASYSTSPLAARPPLSVAPMMAWTDHHFRQLLRLLTARTLLYTEMYPVEVVLKAQLGRAARLQLTTSDEPVAKGRTVKDVVRCCRPPRGLLSVVTRWRSSRGGR